jgi:hypothetical protein
MMTDKGHDSSVVKAIHGSFLFFAVSSFISILTLVNSFVGNEGDMRLRGALALRVYVAPNCVNKTFGEKIGGVIETWTVSSGTSMTVMEIAVHCNVNVSSFVCGSTVKYTSKASRTPLN